MAVSARTLLVGDCIQHMRDMPAGTVHTCVTSPPYFGLRDYGMDGQIGMEDTPDDYVARLVDVFREVRRVLRDDGTLWLNLGDSYAANRGYQVPSTKGGPKHGPGQAAGGKGSVVPDGLKPKDLIGIPWRVAFALQADGWYLRQDIIWHKPNVMPESVRDRCTKAHEYLFLLTKQPRYHFDSAALQEQGVEGVRNKRSVWTVNTKPFKGAHFATFPPALAEPCVLAGAPEQCCAACGAPYKRLTSRGVEAREVDPSALDRFGTGKAGVHRKVGGQYQKWLDENPKQTIGWKETCACASGPVGGTVLDPFFGSGTTGLVAQDNGRSWVGIELNPAYADIARARLGLPQQEDIW